MTDLPFVPQRRTHPRMVLTSTLVGLLCIVAWAGQETTEPFEIGQRWEYRHEGPRPGSMEPNAIDGERTLHVIDVVEESEGKQWIIEERFTKDEKIIGRLHVNEARLITAIEIENEKAESAILRYDPPAPHQVMEMNIGQEETIETSLKMDSAEFSLPSTIVIRRLDNETITTPAGTFTDCQYYKITTKTTFNIKIAKIPVTEERERWYHPKVNGLVKEVYRKGPIKFLTWSRKGYTATSVLTSYGKQEVPVEIRTARKINIANQAKEQPSGTSYSAIGVVFLGATATLALGIYVLKNRARRNKPNKKTQPFESDNMGGIT